jgi:hypothetical protein
MILLLRTWSVTVNEPYHTQFQRKYSHMLHTGLLKVQLTEFSRRNKILSAESCCAIQTRYLLVIRNAS